MDPQQKIEELEQNINDLKYRMDMLNAEISALKSDRRSGMNEVFAGGDRWRGSNLLFWGLMFIALSALLLLRTMGIIVVDFGFWPPALFIFGLWLLYRAVRKRSK